MSTRICQSCGAELADGSLFCPNCGREVAVQVCQTCGTPIPEGSNFCPSCGKGIAAHVCESCGALIPEGSRLCPGCEEKEAARKAQEDALLAQKEAEAIAREKARQEAEAAREKARQEEEAARKAQEAALLAQKEAEAIAREKARQEAEAAREKAWQEEEAARKAQEAALLAQKEAEAIARDRVSLAAAEKERLPQASPVPRSRPRRGWQFIAGGILLLLVVVGIVYFFAFPHPTPEQDDTTATTDITTTNTTATDTTTTTNTTATTDTTTTDTTMTDTTTTDTTTTTETTSTSALTLAEILARAAKITMVKYDTLVTRPGTPASTMRTWVKNNKMRRETTTEEGKAVVILVNGDARTVYRYVPAQNTATKMPYPPPAKTAEDAKSITDYNPKVVGSETIDGKDCLVVEYLESGVPTRMWLWQDYGFPLRVERTVPAGVTVVEFSNIDFADIPDSVFELPAGVQIMQ